MESDTCDTEFAHNVAFKVLTALVNFYIPMSVMLFLYSRIFSEILKRSENIDLGEWAKADERMKEFYIIRVTGIDMNIIKEREKTGRGQ